MHHTYSQLDGAGQATSHGFTYVTHEELIAIVIQELTANNGYFGVGRVWTHTNCIPMGGSFSAQGADLHGLWAAYENRKYFHRLGCLEVTPEVWPMWHTPEGRVALCQIPGQNLGLHRCSNPRQSIQGGGGGGI